MLSRGKNKLTERGVREFKIIKNVGHNAYKLQLLRDMAMSAPFSISDLSP